MTDMAFIVEGDAVTQIARDLMLDDEPGKAYRLLADCLMGDGAMEATLAILKGTHNLVGDSTSGLELVEASPTPQLERYLSQVRYVYAGRYRDGTTWRRPIEYMVRFGPVDGNWACRKVNGDIGDRVTSLGARQARRFAELRVRYYCGPDEKPVVLRVPDLGDGLGDGDAWVITETCGEPPHWWKPPVTAQAALDEALAAGRPLRERQPADPEPSSLRRVMDLERDRQQQQRRDAEANERAQQFELECRRIADTVREQAGSDTFPMTIAEGRVLDVPRAPFVRWALHRTEQFKLAPQWNNVARSGMKLQMDNPDHTDWVLGSGLSLDEAYRQDVSAAALDAMAEFQEQARNAEDARPFPGIFAALENLRDAAHEAVVLVDAGERRGVVGDDIVVFPDSEGHRVGELDDATGVIVEQGGPLAHLVVVAKGRSITIMQCKKACEIFKPGAFVCLNPARGRVTVVDDDE